MKRDDIERHEKVRADWLLHHRGSGSRKSDRRMSNQLHIKASKKERGLAGAAESAHHNAHLKSFVGRWTSGGEDQTDRGGRTFWVIILAAPFALVAGPMLALSSGLYSASTELLLQKKKNGLQRIPKALPWLAAGVLALALAWFATAQLPVRVIQPWPWEVTYQPTNLLFVYVAWQLALGLVLTAWQVRRHGWPGVTIKGAPKLPTMPTPVGPVTRRTDGSSPKTPKLPTGPAIQRPVVADEVSNDIVPDLDDLDVDDIEFEVDKWLVHNDSDDSTEPAAR